MQDLLKDITSKLSSTDYKNEEHVRLGVVYRILQKLGWDIWNPRQVFPELPATPREDATRVDVALFMPPQYQRPTVFIEVKARGKLDSSKAWLVAEEQLRDYNRNNSAEIAILTDGRFWKFYLPSAAGEFSSKLFEELDFLKSADDLTDVELALDAFLSPRSFENGRAMEDAKKYLKRSDEDRLMFDALPIAQRDLEADPSVTLLDCFLMRCREKGVECAREIALSFIKENRHKAVAIPSLGKKENIKPAALVLSNELPGFGSTSDEGGRKQSYASSVGLSKSILRFNHKSRQGGIVEATGVGVNDGKKFVVFKGSTAAFCSSGFLGSYSNLRKKLVDNKSLVLLNDKWIFSEDVEFDSMSAAASVLCGCSMNGNKWK
jgi:predicted type IV restriction endonuclease